jgi:hypothetical protein
MFRAAHASLMILSLLLCPFRCMGAVEELCVPEIKSSGCRCCQHKAAPRSNSNSSTPERPASDCGCGDCVCHGAVVPHKIVVELDYSVDLVPFSIQADECVALEMWDANRCEVMFPPDPLGRDLCLRLQRLLV